MRLIRDGVTGRVALSAAERSLLAIIFVFLFGFLVATPPFEAPDESQHYYKSLYLSQGGVMPQREGTDTGARLPADAVRLVEREFPPADEVGVPRRFEAAEVYAAVRRDNVTDGATAFAYFPNVANYAPTIYAPQAIGLFIGTKFGLSQLGAFYLGRVVNALIWFALLIGALRLLPFGRVPLLVIAALPTSIIQAASLSPDAAIHGLSWLALSLSIRIGWLGWHFRRTAGLALLAPLVALAKGVYLPVLVAGWRIPSRDWPRQLAAFVALALIGALIFVLWMKVSGGTQTLYTIVSRKTGLASSTAPLGDQLAFILSDPAGFVRILASSIVERAPVYAVQIVGREGWNAIMLPLLAYPLAVVTLGVSLFCGQRSPIGWVQRGWWLLLALGGEILTETALYLTGTPLGADYVQGVQGRYLLPFLPLALLAFWVGRARPLIGRGALAERLCVCGSALLLAIGLATAIDAFWISGFTVSDGMPPISDLGSALILPSPRW